MESQQIKSDNQRTIEVLEKANVKYIKELLNYSYMRNGSFIDENPISDNLLILVSENSNDFTKDIAKKAKEGRFNPSEKQSWCMAYQIVNNINVYIMAAKELDNNI
jgi:hypothetical protein